jgi:Zn-dependent protease with chaperone function
MSWEDRDSRLYRIFQELQEKGLIGRRTRLVPCRFTFAVRAYPAFNCIRYRRTFYDRHLARASDDTLRFMLLHEEGHIRKGSSLTAALPALPVLLCLAFLPHPPIDLFPATILSLLPAAGIGLVAAKLGAVALLVLTIVFAYRAYYRRICDEEFIADRYAAEAMKRCYRLRDPGALLQNLLSSIQGRAAGSRSGSDYRPSISERVRRVRGAISAESRTAAQSSR